MPAIRRPLQGGDRGDRGRGDYLRGGIQGVPRFNVEQKVKIQDLSSVEKNFDRLLQENDHLSLYLFPFADKCQVNTWNRRLRRRRVFGRV